MIPSGISMAAAIRVGRALGEGSRSSVRLASQVSLALGVAFMATTGLTFAVAPRVIAGLTLDPSQPESAPVIALAGRLFLVAALFQVVDGVQGIAAGALRGMRDTRVPTFIGAAAFWGVGLTAGYGLGFPHGMGALGLWWGLAAGLASAAVLLAIRLYALIPRLPAGSNAVMEVG